MRKKEYVTDDHLFWTIFADVGNHEAAAMLYLADTLWTIHVEQQEKQQACIRRVSDEPPKTGVRLEGRSP